MIKLLLAACLTPLCGIPCVSAQSGDDMSCVVSVFDAGVKNWGIHALPIKELGEFAVAATTDQMTTRAFRLQGTGLFAVASVSRSGDSQSSEGGATPASFSLLISRKAQLNMRQLDLGQVVRAAAADVGSNDLQTVSVSTVVRRQRRSQIITLACRKSLQR